MAGTIPIALPLIGEEEAEASREVLLSGWLTQGPKVSAFETAFAERVGAPHAVAVSSCTTALHLVLLAAGVGPGDEVITVSHSFIATANAVRYCGAEPVFVDIEPACFNIDPALVAAAITTKTKAILCVHQMGMPCDLAALSELARGHGLPLIEDAACAIGSEIELGGTWRPIGAPVGDFACFSFHPRKVVTTGDGGMITTRDAEAAARLRLLRQHGMSVSDLARHGARTFTYESYPVVGYNYRLTDLQAAVGLVQLTRLDGILRQRRRLAARYAEMLAAVPGATAPAEPAWARSNWQSYCVRLTPGRQADVMQYMLDQGIATRRGIMCAHREAPYAGIHHLPRSEQAQDECILLPLYAQLKDEDQDRVVETLHAAMKSGH